MRGLYPCTRQTLVCKDCGLNLSFQREQEFYAEKGFQNEPVRCKPCRDARKANRQGGAERCMMPECADCGAPQVPLCHTMTDLYTAVIA